MVEPVIILDAITRWLDETIENLTYLEREGFNRFLEETLKDTFQITKDKALKIIETGEPQSRIPVNIGIYGMRKAAGLPLWTQNRGVVVGYGAIPHGLGIITGGLHRGVQNTRIGPTRSTRGKEVRIDTKFSDPPYISEVHDGKPGTAGERPFLLIAAELVERILVQKVSAYLGKLNVVTPPPQFISTLISRSPMKGIVVY